MSINEFGGPWTDVKLERFRKYLPAFTTALKHKHFRLVYIDAFAGTGKIAPKSGSVEEDDLFGDTLDEIKVKDGSALIAAKCDPPFHQLVFIEKDKVKCDALRRISAQYPSLNISILNDDCNRVISKICTSSNWTSQRAVLFLDPFATELDWSTLEAVGRTKSIDTLILFPLSAINRLLRRDGAIPPAWETRLNRVFGTDEWKNHFYRRERRDDLFGDSQEAVLKTADPSAILEFFIERLGQAFDFVHKRPMLLYNTRNSPLFGLCFACGHELALKIMTKILK